MDGIPKMSREQYIEAMRSKFEEILGGVADAVNDAPEGRIINASEEKVRDLFAVFRHGRLRGGLAGADRCGGSRFSPLRRTVTVVPSVTRAVKSGAS